MYLITFTFIVLSLIFLKFLLSRDKGSKEPATGLWTAFLFGLLAIVFSIVVEYFFIPLKPKGLVLILISSLGVGLIEEISKFLPLSLYIYKKDYFNEHTDGIIYFAICGMTFGLIENITYAVGYGVETGIARMILLPLFHAAGASIVGYFLATKKVEGGSFAKTVSAIALVVILHGFYNFGMDSGSNEMMVLSLVLTVLLTVGMFIYFMRANEIDKAEGKSAQGKNQFCRHCGAENINDTLYCEFCGKKS